jgi:hypothetical protein
MLVRHLLEGCKTRSDSLTRHIAQIVVASLREAPAEVREEFLGASKPAAEPPERRFIRKLMEKEGDEESIVAKAADKLVHAGRA